MSEIFGSLPPVVWFVAGAPLLALLSGPPRKVLQVFVPLVVTAHVLSLFSAQTQPVTAEWIGYTLQFLDVTPLRLVFGLIFAIMAVIGSIYSLHVEDRLQTPSAWLYAGGALGVVFAGDLLTLLVFWEAMAIASVMLVLARRTPQARGSALRYAAVHGLGGSILLAGILVWVWQGNSLEIQAIPMTAGLAGWLMLVGVAINAAIPPFNAWLADSYAEATLTGSVFLSAYTTKTAVFVLLALFAGWPVLVWAGVIMALYGVVYAVLENNIRRLLAYSTISQVGYMVAAAGLGTEMGTDGASAHAFSHVLYKSLLFMAAGAVIHATGREKLTELGGLFRAMPVTVGLYAVGAASMSGFPLFNGFVSKSIIVTAAGQGGWPTAEVLLTAASVGTFLHTGLKLFWFTFISQPSRPYERLQPLPVNMTVAMFIGAFFCTLFGVWPSLLYRMLPFASDYHPYTLHHAVQSVQILAMTGLAFWLVLDHLKGRSAVSLDTDWFYRRPLPKFAFGISHALVAAQDAAGRRATAIVAQLVVFLRNPLFLAERLFGRGVLEPERDGGNGAPSPRPAYDENRYRLPVGTAVLAVLIVFGLVALVNLLARAIQS